METKISKSNKTEGLRQLWRDLTRQGVDLAPQSEHQNIIRSNSTAWFMALCGLSYTPLYYSFLGLPAAASLIAILSVGGLFVVVLNSAGYSTGSRVYQSIYFTSAISMLSFVLGAQAGASLMFLPAMTVVFLNFSHRETRSLVLVLAATMAIAIYTDIRIETSSALLHIPDQHFAFLRIVSRLGAMSLILAQLMIFARSLVQSQEQLTTTNQNVVLILDTLQDAFYFVDRSWRIVHANSQTSEALKAVGLPGENLAGRHFFEMNDYMRKQPFADDLIRTMETNASFHGEYFAPMRSKWFELRAQASEHGMSISYRDISERKHAEALLKQNEELQAAIFKQAATGLNLITPSGKYLRVNEEMCRLLGYQEDELLKMSFWDVLVQNDEHDEGSLAALIDGKMKLYSGERYYRHKDGTPIPVNVQVSAIRDLDNRVEFLVVSLQDLSGAKEAEQKLVQASKMSSLGEMAGSIAHEINNPMTIIALSAEQLEIAALDESIDPEMINRISSRIAETVARITKIIRGLKSFSRNAEHDPMTLNSVSALVDDTLELCREKFRNKGVELKIGSIPDMNLMCRPTEISQVVLNLLGNAFDAVESRGGKRWVTLDVFEADSKVKIQVTDCGDGIPEAIAKRILEPFFTTKELGKGTGLGLSISKGIVESHGGRLYLDRACANTRFVIELARADHPQLTESLAG